MNARQTNGFVLLVTALGILVIPGVIVNNAQANGLIGGAGVSCPTGESLDPTGQFCTGNGIVTLAANVGCQANPNYCNLNNQVQVLNTCSPFTGLITLNFATFVQSFFNACGVQGSETIQQTLTTQVTGTFSISSCVLQGSFFNPSTSLAQSGSFCYVSTPPIVTPNGTIGLLAGTHWYLLMDIGFSSLGFCANSQWNGVITNSTLGSVSTPTNVCLQGWTLPPGCTPGTCPISLSASNTCVSGIQAGSPSKCLSLITLNSQCSVSGSYYGTPSDTRNVIKTFSCGSLQTANNFVIPVPGISGALTGLNFGSILSFAASIFGAVLVTWLALGMNFGLTAATFGANFGSNPQGTKLAQTMGLGLLLWFPLYSEFNTWFTSGYFPAGLDGNVLSGTIGIVSVILTVMAFLGLYLISQSPGAASS